jgi:hypothetical protein
MDVQTKPDDGPADAPASITSPDASPDAYDDLLAEFERGTNQRPADNVPPDVPAATQNDPVEALLRDLNDDKRVTDLQGELNGLRAEVHRKAEADAFDKYSAELQSKLPAHLPEDYCRNALLAAASQDPNLELAWGYRNLTNAERRAADLEFKQLEHLYGQVQRGPDDPRKAVTLAQLEQRGRQLGLMMNAPTILRQLERDIEKRASEFKPIDSDATADHVAVAAAVRGASAKILSDPPPNFGRMTDREFRDWKITNLGFE